MLKLFRNTLYVRIRPDHLSVLHVESGKKFEDVPVLAIDRSRGKAAVVAFGHAAQALEGRLGISLANGFEHPRTLIADWTVASETLKMFAKHVLPKSIFLPAPVMVIHPLAMLEGGITQVEERAFRELGMGIGARCVFVWEGAELSRETLLAAKFPLKSDGSRPIDFGSDVK